MQWPQSRRFRIAAIVVLVYVAAMLFTWVGVAVVTEAPPWQRWWDEGEVSLLSFVPLQDLALATALQGGDTSSSVLRSYDAVPAVPIRSVPSEASRLEAVEQYGRRCAEIVADAPSGVEPSVTLGYMLDELGKLTPPPDIEAWHKATLALYTQWRTEGYVASKEEQYEETMREALAETEPAMIDRLFATGCIQ